MTAVPLVDPRLSSLRTALDGVLTRDRGRLLGRWRCLRGASVPAEAEIAALQAAIGESVARREARAATVPDIAVDESLPIAAHAERIVEAIRAHPVVVLAGETGSGKTTQLPKLCLAAGRGAAGLIGCTQPRRIAARSVARRVASELGTEVGGKVGFQVRFTDQVSEASLVKFMTDGILLAETQTDPWLSAYDTIILDEAHERSLNIDFLLGYLKGLLERRRDLKLVVTSAPIDTARFAAHFGGAPVIEVEGRTYPVEIRWRPEVDAAGDPPGARERGPRTETDRIVAAIDELTREDPRGDVLVFLPGEREIRDAHLALSRRKYRETEILALYARLSAAEQDRVFRPGPQRRIVLATNVAETSLTVPRIRCVVDTGTARVKRYNPRNQLERLHVEPISRAAADQRAGRCGRVGPGVCYRLYGEDDYAQRPRFTDPEILRSSLAGVILRMLVLKLGDPARFPFIDPPSERALADGQRRLLDLEAVEAVTGKGPALRVTALGRQIARLPIDVALGRMVVEAGHRGALRDLLVLASFLSIQDPRERPADARQQADAAHAAFADPRSDFVGVLRLWSAYVAAHEELTQSKLRAWCEERFLSFLRMREWRELHRQLLVLVTDEFGWSLDAGPDRARGGRPRGRNVPPPAEPPDDGLDAARYEAIHRCLLSGWPAQVGRRDERGQYRGTRERKFAIFPGSSVAKSPPQWLLAGQILDLSRVYAMLCARVDPAWIEQQAAHLLRRSWRDAHWSRRRGVVVASEQVTLLGLTLVEQRSVTFARQDPALAHAVFVREALARCEIDARAGFVKVNARVLREALEVEARRRRGGLVADEDARTAFFEGKLPADVCSAAALDAWYRHASPKQQAALHWSVADLLGSEAGAGDREFPSAMRIAGHALKLAYRFVPGDPADGVTLEIPLALLNAVSGARCEWLVPGLLAEKVAEAIRALPKALRRNFVPAPDFARAFAEDEAPRDESLLEVLAAWLRRRTGVAIDAAAFAAVELPPHLRMHFRLRDGDGNVLAESRDLAALQANWLDAARDAFSQHVDADFAREDVAAFDFERIPAQVVSEAGLAAFPALVDLGDAVALRVLERRDEAEAEHRRGVERLLRRALADRIKQARRQLPLHSRLALQWAPVGDAESLRADIVEAALRERLAAHDLDVRERGAFEHVRESLARELFPAAVEWLALAEAVIAAQAELRPLLEPPLIGFAKANYDDLREQLDELLAPGFVRVTPRARLAHFPRYLKAMRLRAERLRQDPTRDQARMLGVLVYWRKYLALRAERGEEDEALTELRWLIEELRVSTFAQELRTPEPVSPKRLAKAIEALGAG